MISIYYWLQALSLFGSGIVSFLTIINSGTNNDNNPERISASIVYMVVAIPLGIATTMAGWGLWKMRRWARNLSIGLSVLGVITGLPLNLWPILFNILILVVLFLPKVKEAFSKS